MNAGESAGALAAFSGFVAARLGLHFPPQRWDELARLMEQTAHEFGFDDAEAFVPWLLVSPLTPAQFEVLATNLTIAETFFWREPQIFEALRGSILPELIRTREATSRRLRIWSAGCATGEEAYCIAILLRELIPAGHDWHVTVLATDVNPQVLRRAATGVYGEWSFRNAPPGFKERNFQRTDDGQYQLLPGLRRMVSFAYLNLAEEGYPSRMNNTHAMDVIFCRNVLMYFVPEHAKLARGRLFQALVEGGWLVVAGSELSQRNYAQFTAVRFPGAFIYRREAQPSGVPAAVDPAFTPAPGISAPPRALAVPVNVLVPPRSPATAAQAKDETAAPELPVLDFSVEVRELANQGRLSEARTACEEALTTHKLDPTLHYLHASILQEQKQSDEAQAALKRALYLDPSFVLAHFTLGTVARGQGLAAAAEKSFKNALALLGGLSSDEIVPESDGMTAGRLIAVIRASLSTGALVA